MTVAAEDDVVSTATVDEVVAQPAEDPIPVISSEEDVGRSAEVVAHVDPVGEGLLDDGDVQEPVVRGDAAGIYGGFGDDLVDLKMVCTRPGQEGHPEPGRLAHQHVVDGPAAGRHGRVGDARTLGGHRPRRQLDNGSDVISGGDGPDVMRADVGGAGPVPGDRLIDWFGGHNVFYVCDGAYGAGRVIRVPSPSIVSALEQLAVADGAWGTFASRQLAIPVSGNRNPTHPAHSGNNHGC